jgi:hypothetical protein
MNTIDWNLVSANIREAITRCLIATLWLQLLNVGRLFAGIHYSKDQLAMYGVAALPYQALAGIVISAFLPISVEILSRFGRSKDNSIGYAHEVICKIAPLTLVTMIIVTEVSGPIFKAIFPSYQIDPVVQATLLLSMLFYPFFIVWGNCLIGANRLFTYISIILFGLLTAWGVASYFGSNLKGAAYGQFLGLFVFSLLMYITSPKAENISVAVVKKTMLVFVITTIIAIIYWMFRWL